MTNKEETTLEEKKCSNSCKCTEEKPNKKAAEVAQKTEKIEILDPTHFGDWQVNCRTIDF